MRKAVVLFVSVILLPISATVAQIRLSMVEGAYPGPYNSTKTVQTFGPGDSFTLWTFIESDIDIDGLQYGTHVNGDEDNDLFEITGYAPGALTHYESTLGLTPGSLAGFGDVFSLTGDQTTWAPANMTKLSPLPYPLAPSSPGGVTFIADHVIFRTSAGLLDSPSGTVVGLEISPLSPLPAGDYVFSALGPINGGPMAEYTFSPFYAHVTEGDDFTLTVLTPEPSGALLMLAGLVMASRRRRLA